MKCICCNHEEHPYKLSLTNTEFNINCSFELPYDLCKDCFSYARNIKIASKKSVSFIQDKIALRKQELFLSGKYGLTRKDFLSGEETFFYLKKSGLLSSETANKRERVKIIKRFLEGRKADTHQIPNGINLFESLPVYKKEDIKRICTNYFKAKWMLNSKHALSEGKINELIVSGYAKDKNGKILFAHNLEENKKPCVKCGKIKPTNQFLVFQRGVSWRCDDCANDYAKKRYKENSEKLIEISKQWKRDNKDKVTEYRSKPQTRFARNLRKRLNNFIKINKGRYNKNVGLNSKQTREYIESLWAEGMNWDNYGASKDGVYANMWVVDHKIPIAKWEEYKHYVSEDPNVSPNFYLNLQPMWSRENASKTDSIIYNSPEEFKASL